MKHDSMVLKVVLPSEILLEQHGVIRLVVETSRGSMGFLPLRLDCVALLVPGILLYETQEAGEHYVALAEGILVKAGPSVTVSVHHGVIGADLGELKKTAEEEFAQRESHEKEIEQTLAKLESIFLHGAIQEVHRG